MCACLVSSTYVPWITEVDALGLSFQVIGADVESGAPLRFLIRVTNVEKDEGLPDLQGDDGRSPSPYPEGWIQPVMMHRVRVVRKTLKSIVALHESLHSLVRARPCSAPHLDHEI